MKSWILNSLRTTLLTSPRPRPIVRRNTDVLTTYGIVMRHSEGENLHNSPLCPCTYRVGPRRQRDWCSSHPFYRHPCQRDARFRGNLTVPQAMSFPGHLKGLTLVIQHNYVGAYFDLGLQGCTFWPTHCQLWAIDYSSTKGLISVNKALQTKKTAKSIAFRAPLDAHPPIPIFCDISTDVIQ